MYTCTYVYTYTYSTSGSICKIISEVSYCRATVGPYLSYESTFVVYNYESTFVLSYESTFVLSKVLSYEGTTTVLSKVRKYEGTRTDYRVRVHVQRVTRTIVVYKYESFSLHLSEYWHSVAISRQTSSYTLSHC